VGPGVDAIQMRSEYQLYKDAEYKPQRWIGPVEIQNFPGALTEQALGLEACVGLIESVLKSPPLPLQYGAET